MLCSYKKEKFGTETDTEKRWSEDRVQMKMVKPDREAWNELSFLVHRRTQSCNTLVSGFWPPD